MFLNRDQVISMNAVRQLGYEPVNAIVLTSHNRQKYGTVSVLAIKDDKRYNLRVSIDTKTFESKVVSAFELKTIIDTEQSTDISKIDGCVIKCVTRKPIGV